MTDVLALSLRLTEHNTLPYNYYLEKLHSTCLPHVKAQTHDFGHISRQSDTEHFHRFVLFAQNTEVMVEPVSYTHLAVYKRQVEG